MKRKIMLMITDQADIEELCRKIVRENAHNIYGHEIDINHTTDAPRPYPFQVEEYPDEES